MHKLLTQLTINLLCGDRDFGGTNRNLNLFKQLELYFRYFIISVFSAGSDGLGASVEITFPLLSKSMKRGIPVIL